MLPRIMRVVEKLSVGSLVLVVALATSARAGSIYDSISPKLPAAEQEYMRTVVDQLPARQKARIAKRKPSALTLIVYDANTGQLHTNRPEDAANVEMGADDLLASERAADVALPPCHGPFLRDKEGDFNPGCNAATGPYRRVYTKGAPPLRADFPNYETSGRLTIACKAGQHKIGNGDGPNAYLGGWSTTPDAPYGNVDAGIQYNLDLTNKSTDSYSPFLNIVGVGYIKYGTGTITYKGGSTSTWDGTTHIPCATEGIVTLIFNVEPWEFSVGKHTYHTVALQLFSVPAQGEAGETLITWIAPAPPQVAGTIVAGGWGDLIFSKDANTVVAETPCGGCVFKWMTSIGQTVGHPNYHDGATYSATWSDRYIDYWVGASGTDPVLLTSDMVFCSEYPLWYGTYDFGTRDCTNTPPKQNGISQSVDVTDYLPTGETNTISLTH